MGKISMGMNVWCCAVIISVIGIAPAQEWTQWRGPNRDGVVKGFSTPAQWPKELVRQWKIKIGGGYSSPLVSQSVIYLHSRQEQQEVISSINLNTGKILWSQSYAAPSTKTKEYAVSEGEGPYSTPVLSEGRLYTLGVHAILSCFQARSGKLEWRRDFSKYIASTQRFCGTAVSPIVDRNLIFIHVGDDNKSAIMALDVKTGKEQWSSEQDGPGYASPILAELEGTRQLITLTDKAVIGLAVDSGQLLWRFPFPSEGSGCSQNIVTPIVYEKTIILSGPTKGTLAIKPTKAGSQWQAEPLWHNKDIAMHLSTPVLDGSFLFGLSVRRKGQFFCLDAKTGATLWITQGREGDQAIVLSADRVLTFLTVEGKLIIVRKNSKSFEPVAQYTVADSSVWAHPVLLDRQILIKDTSTLALWKIE